LAKAILSGLPGNPPKFLPIRLPAKLQKRNLAKALFTGLQASPYSNLAQGIITGLPARFSIKLCKHYIHYLPVIPGKLCKTNIHWLAKSSNGNDILFIKTVPMLTFTIVVQKNCGHVQIEVHHQKLLIT